jgi:hypothetical protein
MYEYKIELRHWHSLLPVEWYKYRQVWILYLNGFECGDGFGESVRKVRGEQFGHGILRY